LTILGHKGFPLLAQQDKRLELTFGAEDNRKMLGGFSKFFLAKRDCNAPAVKSEVNFGEKRNVLCCSGLRVSGF